MHRRGFVAALGLSVGLAGCTGSTPAADEETERRFQGPTTENREFVELPYRDFPTSEVQTIRDEATSIDYRDLYRNAEEHVGKSVTYRGLVAQTLEGEEYFQLLIAIEGNVNQLVYVSWTGDRFIREDAVRFWGEVLGVEIYQTAQGAENTVPAIAVADMELLENG